ncbi:hypothetical protein Lesp02_00940 [Lentzea sp. NBRC 105346]|uniref:hypothetical protein n=1 Tax=Lentzea sp. NBRC 105346 TaxID=3032205 RepID=UPI0024A235FF|nr:hypothetical protein [Lentzea sp. NBRC 105346]GLZ27904.1 hypothetical protein Lesp02_00940 [Lentzea sp. NBRC 105346]
MATKTATHDLTKAWFRWVTAGEFAGFLAPALAGALTSSPVLLVVAGIAEGAILGTAQALVLRRVLPKLKTAEWVGVTALAAGFAWAVAMVAVSNGARLAALPLVVQLLIAAVAGTGVLLSIGIAQWLVLHHQVTGAHVWVWANAIAWGAGLIVFTAVTTPLWQPGQPPVLIALIGALGGLLMAATMAAITGATLARLVKRS